MPATPRNITLTDADFEERISYDDLEDGDYIADLVDVEDITASSTDNYGWGFVFVVKGLKIKSSVWLKGGGGWKVREVFNALGAPIAPGTDTSKLNPNILIGRRCVVTVKKEPSRKDPNQTFTNITRHTPLVTDEVPDFSDL